MRALVVVLLLVVAALSYVLGYVNSGTHDATGVQLGVTVPAGTAFSAAGTHTAGP